MQRFGRSAQQKMKDRWGGSFILATVLALLGAWFAGQWLNDSLRGETVKNDPVAPGIVGKPTTNPIGGGTFAATPQNFNLFMVQVGAFRSESGARKLAAELNTMDFSAMVAPKNSAGLWKVYAGLFTREDSANAVKSELLMDGLVTEAWTIRVSVNHNPDVVPVMAQTVKSADFKAGLEAMNVYLHEAAVWVENRTASVEALSVKGQALARLAADLSLASKDSPSVQNFATLAAAASHNAAAIQLASKAAPGSAQQQAAMTEYLAVLEQYRTLQTQLASGNY